MRDLRTALATGDISMGYSFEVTHPTTSARFTLRPLPASPDYHVLWEWDPARSNLKRTDPHAPPLDAAAQARSDAYDAFRRSPGSDTEVEDLRRFLMHVQSRMDSRGDSTLQDTRIGEQP